MTTAQLFRVWVLQGAHEVALPRLRTREDVCGLLARGWVIRSKLYYMSVASS